MTVVYANSQGWLVDVPVPALAGGAGAALAVGSSPAYLQRSARPLDPAEH